MKKLLVSAILLTLFLAACGSSVSDATLEGASTLITDVTTSLTNVLETLKGAENAQAANEVAANFQAELSAFNAKDSELAQKEDYYLINTEKSILPLIDKLSQSINAFKRAAAGESESYQLAAYAAPAAKAMLTDFEGLNLYPIKWLNSCAEAKGLIEALTKLMDDAYVSVRDARDGALVGSALVTYANGVQELAARGTELEAKYPDFKKAANDPSLERPVSDLRAAMITLGKEISDRSKQFEGKDADFDSGMKQMKEILNSIKR